MSENSVLYDVLAERVDALARSFDDNIPYHKFSRRYMRKEKAILKAYLKSKEKQQSIEYAYNSVMRGNRIKFAIIVAIVALLLAGFTIYITHYIGNMRVNEYDTYSLAYVINSDNAPLTLESRFEITYDLSDWDKEILIDNEHLYWEIYKQGDNYFSFSYCVKSSYLGMRYNTEGSEIKKIIINDYSAIFFTTRKGIQCLTYDNGDFIFEFDFTIEYDKAIKIINSIEEK